ncbi:MAG: multicopper oxidase domain-containing protein [Kocuria sp.]|nr:multicopper oxidase domain-containing protein [Kocuria sp.]
MWELRELTEGEDPGATDVIRLTRADGEVMTFKPAAKLFDDTLTIRFSEGDWAVWNIVHLGGPAHPMHIHMTEFQMLNRRQWPLGPGGALPGFDLATGSTPNPLPVPAPGRPISSMTAGMKDTWVVQPGEWVQVLGEFTGATGSFMYHCHILDHEDHTMMRPFTVLPKTIMAFHDVHGGGHH